MIATATHARHTSPGEPRCRQESATDIARFRNVEPTIRRNDSRRFAAGGDACCCSLCVRESDHREPATGGMHDKIPRRSRAARRANKTSPRAVADDTARPARRHSRARRRHTRAHRRHARAPGRHARARARHIRAPRRDARARRRHTGAPRCRPPAPRRHPRAPRRGVRAPRDDARAPGRDAHARGNRCYTSTMADLDAVRTVYVQQTQVPGGWQDHAETEDRAIATACYAAVYFDLTSRPEQMAETNARPA